MTLTLGLLSTEKGIHAQTSSSNNNVVVTTIPFSYDSLLAPFIVVQASVGGHNPLLFVVDTGLSMNMVLTPEGTKKLGLSFGTLSESLSPGSHHVSAPSYQEVKLTNSIENFSYTIKEVPVCTSNFSLPKIYGIEPAGAIGLPLLAAAGLQINFPRRCLVFTQDTTGIPVPPNSTAVTLRRDETTHLFDVLWPPTDKDQGKGPSPAEPANASCLMRLDTGSGSSEMPLSVITQLHPSEALLSETTTAAGDEDAVSWVIPQQKVMSIDLPELTVDQSSTTVGTLGLNILSHFILTFDWTASRLWLTPAGGTDAERIATQDVFLDTDKAGMFIYYVLPGSAASLAGLRTGQRVLSIGGIAADTADDFALGAALLGDDGKQATVTVSDGSGPPRSLSFARRSLADAGSFPASGLQAVPSHQPGSWRAFALLCNAPAFRAGVRPGDELLAVNGKPLKPMSRSKIETLLTTPSGISTLTLKHLGETKTETVSLSTSKT